LDNPGVSFASVITDPAAVSYVPYVEEGVRRFVERRASEGYQIGHLDVTLIAMAFQIVDAKGKRYREAAGMALVQAFEVAGFEL
jgi:hypothetical protein